MKLILIIMILLGSVLTTYAELKIKAIRTASNNVLEVYLQSNRVNVSEPIVTVSSWKINNSAPDQIYHYAMEADSCDHFIYLETETLQEGTQYKISTPYGDTTITFSDHSIFCEAIKTNQAAYSALTRKNYALFAIWLGDGGSKQISGTLPVYVVFEQYTNKIVATGVLEKIGDNPSSGDYVYRIDLSSVPEGGPYKIAVKGYGCSYPFGIGGDFSRRLSYTMFRSQYYQRCGCPIIAPYGMDVRQKPCHSTVYKCNGPIGEANISVKGSEVAFKCYGGYHDAGDADRRAYHMSNPVINLMVYEAFPELFYDGQFNIPDRFDSSFNILGKGNGIPDIIDEAIWGTLVWEYLQNDDGSIQFGTETKGYPEPYEAPLDLDAKKYGTVIIDDRAAAIGAGLFMHLGRILQPYDSVHSRVLVERAEKTFNYIKTKIAKPEKLYYYVQKYLYDGDENTHAEIKALREVPSNYKKHLFGCYGYSLNDTSFDNPGYFLSYLVDKNRSTDTAVVSSFKNALKLAADANLAELDKYAYPVGNNPEGTIWGHNVMQPIYACAPLLQWKFTKEQKYMDGACALVNYIFGLNPLGICYVTGIGMYQVQNPHDRESAYTKEKGLGPKPGITIFGPGVSMRGGNAPSTFPAFSSLPVERKFGDDRNSISTAEFTIFETMSHNALFTVLSNGGTWDEKKDPYATQQPSVSIKNRTRINSALNQSAASMAFSNNVLRLKLVLKSSGFVRGALFSVNGVKVMNIDLGYLESGFHTVALPIANGESSHLAGSVLICNLSIDNRAGISAVINRIY